MKQKHEINQTKEKKKQTMESFIQLFLFIFYQVHFHFVVYFSLLHHSFLLVFFLPFIHSVVGLFCVLCFNYITNEWNECVNLIKRKHTQQKEHVVRFLLSFSPLVRFMLPFHFIINEPKKKRRRNKNHTIHPPHDTFAFWSLGSLGSCFALFQLNSRFFRPSFIVI